MSGVTTPIVRLRRWHRSEGWAEILVHEESCKDWLGWRGALVDVGWLTESPSRIQAALRSMLVAITQENRAAPFQQVRVLHICCRFLFSYFPTLCSQSQSRLVQHSYLLWHLLFIFLQVTFELYAATVRGFIRRLFGVVLCRVIISPPLHLKLRSLSWIHDSCVLQTCWWAPILHLASTWMSQFV